MKIHSSSYMVQACSKHKWEESEWGSSIQDVAHAVLLAVIMKGWGMSESLRW